MHNVYRFVPKRYFGSNTYLIRSGDEFAVVDPSVEYSEVLAQVPELKGRLKYVLLTHAHFDHILKIYSWCVDSARVMVGEGDLAALSDPNLNCYLGFLGVHDGYFGVAFPLSQGDELVLGDDVIRVIECPGHTPGGLGYFIGDSLFIGDTLFAEGGYGRCDLPGGDMEALSETIGLLLALNDDFTLYAGHGEVTTLKETKKYFY